MCYILLVEGDKIMKAYTFFWSPEGRMICAVVAASLTVAKREFKAAYPQYARYMGEVYWTVK